MSVFYFTMYNYFPWEFKELSDAAHFYDYKKCLIWWHTRYKNRLKIQFWA